MKQPIRAIRVNCLVIGYLRLENSQILSRRPIKIDVTKRVR